MARAGLEQMSVLLHVTRLTATNCSHRSPSQLRDAWQELRSQLQVLGPFCLRPWRVSSRCPAFTSSPLAAIQGQRPVLPRLVSWGGWDHGSHSGLSPSLLETGRLPQGPG